MWSGSAQVPLVFFVSAGVKMPIGLQLRASWPGRQILPHRAPSRLTVAAHVVCRDLIRDPLKAEIMNQAVEQHRGVVPFNCRTQILVAKLVEQIERARETANLMNN